MHCVCVCGISMYLCTYVCGFTPVCVSRYNIQRFVGLLVTEFLILQFCMYVCVFIRNYALIVVAAMLLGWNMKSTK